MNLKSYLFHRKILFFKSWSESKNLSKSMPEDTNFGNFDFEIKGKIIR